MGEALPSFWVHPGDGNIFCYYELFRQLGTKQPLYGLQAFGLDPDTSPLTHVEEMATKYIDVLRSVYPDGPYLLGGFCTGGIIAYEMAQQIQCQGEEVPLLILLDTQPPHLYSPFEDDIQSFIEFGHDFAGLTGIDILPLYYKLRSIDPEEGINGIRRDLELLSQRERLDVLLGCGRQAGKLSPDTEVDYFERVFQVYLAGAAATRNYKVQPYDGRIVFIRAIEGPGKEMEDRTLGWGRYASAIEVYDIPGNHFAMLRSPYVEDLAARLLKILAGV
jgi:thioesterase domain-containing protein